MPQSSLLNPTSIYSPSSETPLSITIQHKITQNKTEATNKLNATQFIQLNQQTNLYTT